MKETRLNRTVRTTLLGLSTNLAFAAGKLMAGVLGNSHALIADAVESFADVFSSIVVWRGLVVAAAPADADHPYGHGKAEPIAAAVVSSMVLIAAGWIAIQALQDVFHPHLPPSPITLLVLLVVVAVKELLFRYALREGTSADSFAVRSDAWHHRSDAVTSLCAAIGISVAILGGKGYERADDIAALVSALIISRNGWVLLRPALDELMDTAPSLAVREEIERAASGVSGVDRVEKCIVRKMGYQYFVDMHVEVSPVLTVQAAHEIAHRVKDQVREAVPAVRDVLVHIEPSSASGRGLTR